jgi:Uma2 family endonuclease
MQQRIPSSDIEDPRLAALPPFPTMYDLPSEDPEEPGLPDDYHDLQPQLLSRTLRLSGHSSPEIYTASDLNLYYDLTHPLWHKRPDWFLVVGVPRLYPQGDGDRDSYVLWQEKVSPAVIIEFLSPGTEADDLGRFAPKPLKPKPANSPPYKFTVYEQILQVPHYIVFNKRDQSLRYFLLVQGAYQEQIVATSNPRLWIPALNIGLGIWRGTFEGMPKSWLRWCDAHGNLFLTDTETALERETAALAQQQQAELEREQAELERERAQRSLQRMVLSLSETGMAIAQIAQMSGLSEREVGAIVSQTD